MNPARESLAPKITPYLLSLCATAFPNALGLLAFPLYAKALGPANYGIIALLEAYQGFFSILLFPGMATAFYVFYSHAKSEKEQKQIFATSAYFGSIGLLFTLIIALFSKSISLFLFQNDSSALFITIYAFALFSDYMLTLVNTYLRIQGKIASLAYNAIFIALIHHGLTFYAVILAEGGITEFIALYFMTKSMALLLVACRIKQLKLPLKIEFFSKSLSIRMLGYGTPLILTAISGWVLLFSDRLFIDYYVTVTDVGIYAVAYKFVMGLWIGIVQPFMTVWEPSLFRSFLSESLQGYLKLKKDFTRYLGGIVILYGAFILFIKEVLNFIFTGSDFTNESTLVYLLAASYFLMAIGEMAAAVCRLHKTSSFAGRVALTVICIKLISNAILIPNYLLIGAAIASIVAEIVSQTMMFRFAAQLSHPRRLFFSLPNTLLVFLFVMTEMLLLTHPGASTFLKSLLFVGLSAAATFIVLGVERKSNAIKILNRDRFYGAEGSVS